jgi:glycosyltransferase involved in cell wall biosynthesis
MIHVAVDANALAWGWGGIPRYIERLATRLAARDDVRLTLLTNRSGPSIAIAGTREVACRRRGGALWRNGFVRDWLARERPDVYWAAETLVPWGVPVPLVATVHDLGAVLVPHAKPATLRLAYRTSIPRMLRRAVAVIAVSRTTAHDAQRLWRLDPARVRVIPLGVDERFRVGDRAAASASVAARWGLRNPFVLAVGALEPRKGLEVLIDAAARAARDGGGWRLALAGRPGHRGAQLERRAAAAGGRLLGGVTDSELVELYRAADVVAMPSLYEGFGLPALEAMACGAPVVVAGGSGGLVETSRPAALVVDRRDPAAWLDGIAAALARRDVLSRAGAAHAARFSWERAAADTAAVLHDAAGR